MNAILDIAHLMSQRVKTNRRDQVAADIVRGFFRVFNKALQAVMEDGRVALAEAHQATHDLQFFIGDMFDYTTDEVEARFHSLLDLGADPETAILELIELYGTYESDFILDEKTFKYSFVIDLLLDRGAPADTQFDHHTPLMLASYWNARNTVRRLLDLGVDVKRSLAYAFYGKDNEDGGQLDVELIRMLIDAGGNVEDGVGIPVLQSAVISGQSEVVDLLLKAGADVDAMSEDGEGKTALILAIEYNRIEIAEMLLDADVDFYEEGIIENNELITPLEAAEKYNCDEILEMLRRAEEERGGELKSSRVMDDYRRYSLYYFELSLPFSPKDAEGDLADILGALKASMKYVRNRLRILELDQKVDFSLLPRTDINAKYFARGGEEWNNLVKVLRIWLD